MVPNQLWIHSRTRQTSCLAKKINETHHGSTKEHIRDVIDKFQKHNLLAGTGANVDPLSTSSLVLCRLRHPMFQLTDGETQATVMEQFQMHPPHEVQQSNAFNNNASPFDFPLCFDCDFGANNSIPLQQADTLLAEEQCSPTNGLLAVQKHNGEIQKCHWLTMFIHRKHKPLLQ